MLCALILAVIACVFGTLWWLRRKREVLSNPAVSVALTDSAKTPTSLGDRRKQQRSEFGLSRCLPTFAAVPGKLRVRLDDASWVDVLSCLDRPSLDCVERLARRYRRLVTGQLADKCLRRLLDVNLKGTCADFSVDFSEVKTRNRSKGGRCDWFQPKTFHDFNEAVDFFFRVVRGTAIGTLKLYWISITNHFVEKLHEACCCMSVRKEFILFDVRVTPEMLRSLFAGPFVNVAQLNVRCCKLLASHINDALLNGVSLPVDATGYDVSEEAILDFLFRDEFNGADAGDRELLLNKVAVTQHFFGRLVEHNLTSPLAGRTTLKIDGCAAQDTTLYQSQRISTDTTDRYEFQAAVRFQLVVFPRALEMRRGTDHEDGSPFFV